MNNIINFIKEHYDCIEEQSASTDSVYLKVKKNDKQICKIRISDHNYTTATGNDLYITKCSNIDNGYITEVGCCKMPLYYEFDRLKQFIDDFIIIKYVNIVTGSNCKKAAEIKKRNVQKTKDFTAEELKDPSNWNSFVNNNLNNDINYSTLSDGERKAVRKLFTADKEYSYEERVNIINLATDKSNSDHQSFVDIINTYIDNDVARTISYEEVFIQDTPAETAVYIRNHIKKFIFEYLLIKYDFFKPLATDGETFTKVANIFSRNVHYLDIEKAFDYLITEKNLTLSKAIQILDITTSVFNIVNCIKTVPDYVINDKRQTIIDTYKSLYDYYINNFDSFNYIDLCSLSHDSAISSNISSDDDPNDDPNETVNCDYYDEHNSIGWIQFAKKKVSRDIKMWKSASNSTRKDIKIVFEMFNQNYNDVVDYINSFRTGKEFRNDYKYHILIKNNQ